MMVGINLDVQPYDKVCMFLTEVLAGAKYLKYSWLPFSVVVVAHKMLRCFAPVEEAEAAASVLDRSSVYSRNTAFKEVAAPEQYCSSPLLKVERSVLDRFLKRSESSLNNFIGAELQWNLVLVNDLFKSKRNVANCMMDRASVHTANTSEQFLHCNRALISVHTVPEQLLKRSKGLSGTV